MIIPVGSIDEEQWWADLFIPGGHVKQIETLAREDWAFDIVVVEDGLGCDHTLVFDIRRVGLPDNFRD